MKKETMKARVEKELSNMGYAELKGLIEKYWVRMEYLSKSRDKATYIIVANR